MHNNSVESLSPRCYDLETTTFDTRPHTIGGVAAIERVEDGLLNAGRRKDSPFSLPCHVWLLEAQIGYDVRTTGSAGGKLLLTIWDQPIVEGASLESMMR
jgi:hypothetical protein